MNLCIHGRFDGWLGRVAGGSKFSVLQALQPSPTTAQIIFNEAVSFCIQITLNASINTFFSIQMQMCNNIRIYTLSNRLIFI